MAIKSYPFVIIYKKLEQGTTPALFGVSVSKKRFRKAVNRNRLKRLIREAYRHRKHVLYDAIGDMPATFATMFLYIGKEEVSFEQITLDMNKALKKFVKSVL